MTTTATLTETVRMMAVCPRCQTPHSEDIAPNTASEFFYLTSIMGGGQTPHRACRNCGRGLHTWRSLTARHNPAVKCNARCTNARRADCECSCAGAHHGEGN